MESSESELNVKDKYKHDSRPDDILLINDFYDFPYSNRSSAMTHVMQQKFSRQRHQNLKLIIEINYYISLIVSFVVCMLKWNLSGFENPLKVPLLMYSVGELICLIFGLVVILIMSFISFLRRQPTFIFIGLYPLARDLGRYFQMAVFLIIIINNSSKGPIAIQLLSFYVILTLFSMLSIEIYWLFFVKDSQYSSILQYEKNFYNIRLSQLQRVRDEIKLTGLRV